MTCYVEYKLGRSVIQVDEDEDPLLAQVLGNHLKNSVECIYLEPKFQTSLNRIKLINIYGKTRL
jgi:hypothetical protein